jgi:hypothetical protein
MQRSNDDIMIMQRRAWTSMVTITTVGKRITWQNFERGYWDHRETILWILTEEIGKKLCSSGLTPYSQGENLVSDAKD